MLKNIIPTEFYKDGDENGPVYAETVDELITELKRLPPTLPINMGFNAGAQLSVYNVLDEEDCHLEVEEAT